MAYEILKNYSFSICPHCKSESRDLQKTDTSLLIEDTDSISLPLICLDCSKTWEEVYYFDHAQTEKGPGAWLEPQSVEDANAMIKWLQNWIEAQYTTI